MFQRKRRTTKWSDLSRRNRAAILVLAIVQLVLLVAALWDLRQRPQAGVRGSKRLWTLAAFINFVGPILYFWKGRRPMPADRLPEAA